MSTKKNCGSNRLKLKRQKIKSKGSQGFWNLPVLNYKLYLEKTPPPRKKWDKLYNLPRCSRAPYCFAELSPQKCCSVPNCFLCSALDCFNTSSASSPVPPANMLCFY